MKKTLLLVLTFSLFSTFAFAEAKFGYIDLKKAMHMTKAGKQAKNELEAEFKKKEKKLEDLKKSVEKMKEDLDKKSLVMSEDVKKRKQMEFQKEYLKLQQIYAQSRQEMQESEFKKTKPILEKLQKVIDEVANKEGYSMIFEKSEQNVMWAKSSLDITDQVVKAFEKKK